jgi:diguanylate cyclase (GGDEF)-like protein
MVESTPGSTNETPQIGKGLLLSLLEQSQYFAVLLDVDGRIAWGTPSFLDELAVLPGDRFEDHLSAPSALLFKAASATLKSGTCNLELQHPVKGGLRTVTYRFQRDAGGKMAGLGIDRSQEIEMVSQMAVLIEDLEAEINRRIALAEHLESLAITDSLTGLFNRRHFDAILKQEWARWKRYRSRFGLILIDIDNFKAINDRFGHPAGDEVLRVLAEVIQRTLRSGDTAARYGGEEFAVIAIGVTPKSARELAERLSNAIRNHSMPSHVGTLTVSVGVVTAEQEGLLSAEHMLSVADSYLYQAKRVGRDRVVSALDGAVGPPAAAGAAAAT